MEFLSCYSAQTYIPLKTEGNMQAGDGRDLAHSGWGASFHLLQSLTRNLIPSDEDTCILGSCGLLTFSNWLFVTE